MNILSTINEIRIMHPAIDVLITMMMISDSKPALLTVFSNEQ